MLEVWETRSSGEKSLTGFEQKKYSVYFIQEMHCTEDNKNDWRAECSLRSCPFPIIPLCLSREDGMIHLFVGSHAKKPESGLFSDWI